VQRDADGTQVSGAPDPVEALRGAIASALDARIAGPGGKARWDEMLAAPGPRLIGADSAVHTVHADIATLVGGLRALLLQSLHPLAMAGVAEHSNYRADPWGRLQRTADFLGTVTFGPLDRAERAIAAVRRVHDGVEGTAPDGRRYRANDPHLLTWIHIAEVDSFLVAHQRYGEHRLTEAQQDGYVADMAVIADRLGAAAVPRSRHELDVALAAYDRELRSTPEARAAARYLIAPPGLGVAERVGYAPVLAGAVALLPLRARWMLRLPFAPITERVLVRPVTATALGLGRWSRPRPDSPRVA